MIRPAAGLPPCPAALVEAGAARLGAFVGAHRAVELAALASPGLGGRLRHLARAKRWVWALAVSDEVLVAAAIVEAGWFAGGFAWALDRRGGTVLFEASAAGLPGRTARVAGRAAAPARLTARGLQVELVPGSELVPESATLALRVRGIGFAVDAVLDPLGAPAPFTFVAPVPDAGVRATTKLAGLAARGTVSAAGRTFSLEGGAGGLDFTAGVLARETSWRWAFASRRSAERGAFGFNLCEGFGVAASDPGENAGFLGTPYRLPPVVFQVGGPKAPWSIRSASGGVALTFEPQGAHAEARNLGLISTRLVQVAGTFEGRIPAPDGSPLRIVGLPGVVEDHWARW